jgi:hypothetical protein
MNTSEILKYLRNPQGLNEKTLTALKTMTEQYPWYGTGWILYARNLKNVGHPDFQDVLRGTALRVPDRGWLKRFLEEGNQPEIAELNENPDHLADEYFKGDRDSITDQSVGTSKRSRLIEHFLSGRSGLHPPSLGEENIAPPDLAEEAVRENDDIMTEKYANLLLQQSKFEKALRIFERLSLKYPEKSVYFAARIKEVKQLSEQK